MQFFSAALRRHAQRRAHDDNGFTLVELMVALTLITVAFTSLGYLMIGSIKAYGDARQRSAFVEIANKEMEKLRAMPYGALGVQQDDPAIGAMYGSPPERDGNAAVVIGTADPDYANAPPAVTVVERSSSEYGFIRGVRFPFTVRRWITWEDPSGGAGEKLKRIEVDLQWTERGGLERHFTLDSVRYPGKIGPGAGATVNAAPTINSYSDVEISPNTYEFTAVASDPDGDLLSYRWDFGDGTPAQVRETGAITHTFAAPGFYDVTIQVSDGRGGGARDQRTVQVDEGCGAAPVVVAALTGSPESGVGPVQIDFSITAQATGSLKYRWDFGDGSAPVVLFGAANVPHTTSHEFAPVALQVDRTVTVTISDACNQSAPAAPEGDPAATAKTVTIEPGGCAVTTARFDQQNNATPNDVIVKRQPAGAVENNMKTITFTVRTSINCAGVRARLPLAAGAFVEATLQPVGGAPSGYIDWRGSNAVANGRFDTTPGAVRTWDVFSPASTAQASLSPGFTMRQLG